MDRATNQIIAGIQQFKRQLETYRDEANRFLHQAEAERSMLDNDGPQDIADRCVTNFSREYLFERSSQKRQLLQMTDAALQRIREGTFGRCLSCGEEINPKRLKAMPWAQYCIECQKKLE